jgi:acetyltransferase-like isoleucine patch superfamily enzyme
VTSSRVVAEPAELRRRRADARPEKAERGAPHRVIAIRLLTYLTNHVIGRVPSFALRRFWYARVLGASIGHHAGVHLGCVLTFYGPGQIRRTGFRLGAYTRVNRDCRLDVRGGLEVGDNVSISPEVTVLTASHAVDDPEFPVELRAVVMEDHVWVGTRALILPGVTLGRGSVIAAGSVVTRDVPELAVVAGVPARQVGVRSGRAVYYTLENPFPLFE